MQKNRWVKLLGGLSIMTGVFLLLVLVTNLDQAADGARYAFNNLKSANSTNSILTNLTGQSVSSPSQRIQPLTSPPGIIQGTFTFSPPGDLVKSIRKQKESITEHHRLIQSDQLKNISSVPILKLEIYQNDNTKAWIRTEITKFDRTEGKIYFLLKTRIENKIVAPNVYTGNYQIILPWN